MASTVLIAIETLDNGRLRGYSEALRLYVCWEEGRLRFFVKGGAMKDHRRVSKPVATMCRLSAKKMSPPVNCHCYQTTIQSRAGSARHRHKRHDRPLQR